MIALFARTAAAARGLALATFAALAGKDPSNDDRANTATKQRDAREGKNLIVQLYARPRPRATVSVVCPAAYRKRLWVFHVDPSHCENGETSGALNVGRPEDMMTGRDDILIAILTDRLRLVIQIRDDEQPGMRHELAQVERCLLAYETKPHRPMARAVHDLELVA